jgi:hypothetical protein
MGPIAVAARPASSSSMRMGAGPASASGIIPPESDRQGRTAGSAPLRRGFGEQPQSDCVKSHERSVIRPLDMPHRPARSGFWFRHSLLAPQPATTVPSPSRRATMASAASRAFEIVHSNLAWSRCCPGGPAETFANSLTTRGLRQLDACSQADLPARDWIALVSQSPLCGPFDVCMNAWRLLLTVAKNCCVAP